MTVITSKSNEIIRYANNIKDKKFVREFGECLAESDKVIADLLSNNVSISTILVNNTKIAKFSHILNKFKGKVVHINQELCEYLSDSVTPSGIFAFVKVPYTHGDIIQSRSLVLDNLQDPTNLGAIIRSALAFGFKDIILVNSVFPYSSKVIRSSMGYVFNINMHEVDLVGLKRLINENNLTLICADMDGIDIRTFDVSNNYISLVIGNEGNGVSDEIRALCKHTVKINMLNNVESLNASVSASILMHYLSEGETLWVVTISGAKLKT